MLDVMTGICGLINIGFALANNNWFAAAGWLVATLACAKLISLKAK